MVGQEDKVILDRQGLWSGTIHDLIIQTLFTKLFEFDESKVFLFVFVFLRSVLCSDPDLKSIQMGYD